ncbi:MAG: phosphate/phosphite/phosphonate ABC transporter substrate-binding protein [Lachnospiraceae bacterium]|nr:phosphate/phosphite/phosphonate ABC transporter substrate-binding protein [Lachnospiraceae bacterium]
MQEANIIPLQFESAEDYEADAADYQTDGEYGIDNIVGKRMSFVSNSSTSGFKVPANANVRPLKTMASVTLISAIRIRAHRFYERQGIIL